MIHMADDIFASMPEEELAEWYSELPGCGVSSERSLDAANRKDELAIHDERGDRGSPDGGDANEEDPVPPKVL